MSDIPNLHSIKIPPIMVFCLLNAEQQPIIQMFADGQIIVSEPFDSEDAAKRFWASLSSNLPPQFSMITDLQFCKTVLESKGILWRNSNDQAEVATWLGQMGQRWGLK